LAQLGFAVAGAAVGAMFGMPQLGWIAGAAIGGLMFPAKGPAAEGPRLGDLSISSSAYGMPIAIIYGTMRVAGNMIWSSGIREKTTRQKAGGKGGGKQTQTRYTYFASFLLSFGEGPAEDVLRLWADGKLIYDKTTTGNTTRPGLTFRFHPGSESQLPDPLIEAHVGAGRAPAHRGLCTIMFEELALADFGNRIPNITAEITYKRATEQPYQAIDMITPAEGAIFNTYQIDELAVDRQRAYGYFLHTSTNPETCGLRRFSLRTMKEDRQVRMTDVTGTAPNDHPSRLYCGEDSHLYLAVGISTNQRLIRIEPNALREVARFGLASGSTGNTINHFGAPRWFALLSAQGLGGRVDFLLVGGQFSSVGLLRADTLSYVWGAGQSVDEFRVRGVVRGAASDGFAEGWVLGGTDNATNSTASMAIYRLRASALAYYDPSSGQSMFVTFETLASIPASAIDPAATGYWGAQGGLSYDPTDDSLIIQAQMSNAGTPGTVYTLKWRAGAGIVWKTVVPHIINYEGSFFAQSRLQRQRWTVMRGRRVVQLDTATGAITRNEQWPTTVDEWGAQVYDAVTDTHLIRSAQGGWTKLSLGRGGGQGEALSAIVADLCGRAGLTGSDIDVAELSEIVPGYVISRQTTVRGAIAPLSQGYVFDGVESDDILRFRKRGRAPVATIASGQLVPMSAEESWRERRTQDVELPERVNVIAFNRNMDYQQSAQSETRIALTPPASPYGQPIPAMHSRSQVSVELPIALDATTAKRMAARMLYAAWIERSSYEALLPPDWLRLEPTDVVDVAFPGGSTFRPRITRIDTGADFSISLKGVSEAATTYVSTVAADGGQGLPASFIADAAPTSLILPDIPLLRDVDDTAGAASRIYALGGYGASGWSGAALYRSADGTSWTQAGRLPGEAAWGATLNALGPPPLSPFCTDEQNTLTVAMTAGGDVLESITQEAMLNGANPALVIKANGEAEVIQFRDVSVNPTGTYTLSGLLRGRRGTDGFASGHQAGEIFVLLDAEDIEPLAITLGEIGLPRLWRAVSFGMLFEDASIETRTFTGRDLKPYAPWAVKAVKSGNPANITISWARRTRIGGEWKDGAGTVPLAEATEAYEVDILDAPGGAVKRTLTAAMPSTIYANADILADFEAVPASLSVVVYQISAVIGRGFPRAVTVEIP
jgi:hypothetical protein